RHNQGNGRQPVEPREAVSKFRPVKHERAGRQENDRRRKSHERRRKAKLNLADQPVEQTIRIADLESEIQKAPAKTALLARLGPGCGRPYLQQPALLERLDKTFERLRLQLHSKLLLNPATHFVGLCRTIELARDEMFGFLETEELSIL